MTGNPNAVGFGRRKQPVKPGSGDESFGRPANAAGGGPVEQGDAPSKEKVGDDVFASQLVDMLELAYSESGGRARESRLSAIGALAGFAAQQAIWEGFVRPGRMAITGAFDVVQTKSGETFFFGDLLNTILASTTKGVSVWRLVGSGAITAGATDLPDLEPIFANAAATAGGTSFGVPRLPPEHLPTENPRDALIRLWPKAKALLIERKIEALFWPLEIALAAQRLIVGIKSEIDPKLAAVIVMEAAIPMSKVDPLTIPGGK
jgi:hypothetical protein